MSAVAPDASGSRRRHPSGRTPVPVPAVAARVAMALAGAGAPWPEVAAAVLADRGTTGRSPAAYAASLGIDEVTLERAESGSLGPTELPAPLLRVVAGRR